MGFWKTSASDSGYRHYRIRDGKYANRCYGQGVVTPSDSKNSVCLNSDVDRHTTLKTTLPPYDWGLFCAA
jgi:hypothetical protein